MDTQLDLTNIILETDRLILRLFKETDLQDFYDYAKVEGVGEMAGWPHHKSIEETKEVLEANINDKNVFAIILKSNQKLIGSIGYYPSWTNEEENYDGLIIKEIGYTLSKDYWGLGIMPEALNKVINYSFNKLMLDALTVGHFTFNNRSRRLIEKCGFTYVKGGIYPAELLNKMYTDKLYILFNPNKIT